MTSNNTILIVDDNVEAVMVVSQMLEREGLRVFAATSGAEAIRLALEESIDVAIRIGRLDEKQGSTVRRRAGWVERILVASPELLGRLGELQHPEQLRTWPRTARASRCCRLFRAGKSSKAKRSYAS